MNTLPFNYIDLIIVALLIVGIFRGRKRGMSEELLSFLQWLIIILGGSQIYKAGGEFIKQTTPFSLMVCYVMIYVLFALTVKFLFTQIRHAVGEKLLGSNFFGGSEYYLGMLAGMIRFGCAILMVMALVNARYITPKEREEMARFQRKNFEDISFPTFGSIQQSILADSFLGNQVKEHLSFLLIDSTPWQGEPLRRKRDKALDDVMGNPRR